MFMRELQFLYQQLRTQMKFRIYVFFGTLLLKGRGKGQGKGKVGAGGKSQLFSGAESIASLSHARRGSSPCDNAAPPPAPPPSGGWGKSVSFV